MKQNTPRWQSTRQLLVVMAACVTSTALAAPQPTGATDGVAFDNPAPGVTNITAPDNAIIDYAGFNVGSGETVNFIQPGAAARVLNRINTNTPTQIDGTINANGIVYFVNPAGVTFGPGSVTDAAGIFAAAGSLSNSDFLAGNHNFTNITGDVTQRGIVRAEVIAAFIGKDVTNTGTISVPNGTVVLASGEQVLLGSPLGGVMVSVDTTEIDGGSVNQNGTIKAKEVSLVAGDLASLAMAQAITSSSASPSTPNVTIAEIDTDGDGDIDFDDINTALANFTGSLPPGTGGRTQQQGDTDGDGDIDNTDIGTLIIYFTGSILPPDPQIADAASLDLIGEFEPITEFVNLNEADLDILSDQLGIAARPTSVQERVEKAQARGIYDDFKARGNAVPLPDGAMVIANSRLDHDVVREALNVYRERLAVQGVSPAERAEQIRFAVNDAYQQYTKSLNNNAFDPAAFCAYTQQRNPGLINNLAAFNELRRLTKSMGLSEAEKLNSERTVVNSAKPQAMSLDQMIATIEAAEALNNAANTTDAG